MIIIILKKKRTKSFHIWRVSPNPVLAEKAVKSRSEDSISSSLSGSAGETTCAWTAGC